ncbi:MAG: hypothetical protein Q7T91_09235 [Sulfuricurvum sp.]|nr:hypothetical protein [Sulfuricurvum sp.]
MQINSYVFQSPYSQPVQVGHLVSSKADTQQQSQESPVVENKKASLTEGKIAPTLGAGITVSVGTVAEGNAQSDVSAFKSLVAVTQAQKAYSI